jgi:hypothetical protein
MFHGELLLIQPLFDKLKLIFFMPLGFATWLDLLTIPIANVNRIHEFL